MSGDILDLSLSRIREGARQANYRGHRVGAIAANGNERHHLQAEKAGFTRGRPEHGSHLPTTPLRLTGVRFDGVASHYPTWHAVRALCEVRCQTRKGLPVEYEAGLTHLASMLGRCDSYVSILMLEARRQRRLCLPGGRAYLRTRNWLEPYQTHPDDLFEPSDPY